jgi:uncharacterized protein YecT (DUF1311 family)
VILAIGLALAFTLGNQDTSIDRTAVFTDAYRACESRAGANVDSSFCLNDELERQRIQMREAARELERYATADEVQVLSRSQQLWLQSVEFDCVAEANMGGSAAISRALACEIGLTIARTYYLKTRGTW